MHLEHVIYIDAPPAVVWAVTEEVERWPEWAPTMEAVTRLDEGAFDVGSEALIKQPGLPETIWWVTALTRGVSFTWKSRVRGIAMAATHELEADGNGTKNTLRLETSGLMAHLLAPLLRSPLQQALAQENEGLKRYCEARVTV